jgi:hypothetical protein
MLEISVTPNVRFQALILGWKVLRSLNHLTRVVIFFFFSREVPASPQGEKEAQAQPHGPRKTVFCCGKRLGGQRFATVMASSGRPWDHDPFFIGSSVLHPDERRHARGLSSPHSQANLVPMRRPFLASIVEIDRSPKKLETQTDPMFEAQLAECARNTALGMATGMAWGGYRGLKDNTHLKSTFAEYKDIRKPYR